MPKLSFPWPPVCHLCGRPILTYDTAVVVLSHDTTVREIERAKYVLHRFCAGEELTHHSLDLRLFAELVRKADRKERSE